MPSIEPLARTVCETCMKFGWNSERTPCGLYADEVRKQSAEHGFRSRSQGQFIGPGTGDSGRCDKQPLQQEDILSAAKSASSSDSGFKLAHWRWGKDYSS